MQRTWPLTIMNIGMFLKNFKWAKKLFKGQVAGLAPKRMPGRMCENVR